MPNQRSAGLGATASVTALHLRSLPSQPGSLYGRWTYSSPIPVAGHDFVCEVKQRPLIGDHLLDGVVVSYTWPLLPYRLQLSAGYTGRRCVVEADCWRLCSSDQAAISCRPAAACQRSPSLVDPAHRDALLQESGCLQRPSRPGHDAQDLFGPRAGPGVRQSAAELDPAEPSGATSHCCGSGTHVIP